MISIREQWDGPGGFRHVLAVSLPLVASMASTTVMQFTDRLFLSHYSLDSIAAASPAGIASFLFFCFFMGVGEYVSVFVAQYTGARKPERVGVALWQGIYFVIPSALLLLLAAQFGTQIFTWAGHSPAIRDLEAIYFSICTAGAGISLLAVCFSTFYSGRGITQPVMVANMLGAAVNIPLDYCMINGFWFIPEMGIRGAAWATVIGWCVTAIILGFLVFSKANEKAFCTRSGRDFDFGLFKRLMRFGLPGGVLFFLEIAAITFFMFMIGRIGTEELAASNMVFALDTLAFLPTVGLGIAASVLVGQAIGAKDIPLARRSVRNVMTLGVAYMGAMAAAFILVPEPLILLFKPADVSLLEFAPIKDMAVILLRFVAVYCFVDAWGLIYSGALRGAGDTPFVMKAIFVVALFTMVIPLYIMDSMGVSVYVLWVALTIYVLVLTSVFYFRYKSGVWETKRVIES